MPTLEMKYRFEFINGDQLDVNCASASESSGFVKCLDENGDAIVSINVEHVLFLENLTISKAKLRPKKGPGINNSEESN